MEPTTSSDLASQIGERTLHNIGLAADTLRQAERAVSHRELAVLQNEFIGAYRGWSGGSSLADFISNNRSRLEALGHFMAAAGGMDKLVASACSHPLNVHHLPLLVSSGLIGRVQFGSAVLDALRTAEREADARNCSQIATLLSTKDVKSLLQADAGAASLTVRVLASALSSLRIGYMTYTEAELPLGKILALAEQVAPYVTENRMHQTLAKPLAALYCTLLRRPFSERKGHQMEFSRRRADFVDNMEDLFAASEVAPKVHSSDRAAFVLGVLRACHSSTEIDEQIAYRQSATGDIPQDWDKQIGFSVDLVAELASMIRYPESLAELGSCMYMDALAKGDFYHALLLKRAATEGTATEGKEIGSGESNIDPGQEFEKIEQGVVHFLPCPQKGLTVCNYDIRSQVLAELLPDSKSPAVDRIENYNERLQAMLTKAVKRILQRSPETIPAHAELQALAGCSRLMDIVPDLEISVASSFKQELADSLERLFTIPALDHIGGEIFGKRTAVLLPRLVWQRLLDKDGVRKEIHNLLETVCTQEGVSERTVSHVVSFVEKYREPQPYTESQQEHFWGCSVIAELLGRADPNEDRFTLVDRVVSAFRIDHQTLSELAAEAVMKQWEVKLNSSAAVRVALRYLADDHRQRVGIELAKKANQLLQEAEDEDAKASAEHRLCSLLRAFVGNGIFGGERRA